jgi:hypothetical protein
VKDNLVHGMGDGLLCICKVFDMQIPVVEATGWHTQRCGSCGS